MKKIFTLLLLMLIALVILSCEGEKLTVEQPPSSTYRFAPAEIHNNILNDYYSAYDFSDWENIITNEFNKGTFHKNGILDDDLIASYIWDNQSTFFDENLYLSTVNSVNTKFNITLPQTYKIPLPFNNTIRKKFWNMDNLADGYKLMQTRGTINFKTEWTRYLVNEIKALNSYEINHLITIYEIMQDQSISSIEKESRVLNLNSLVDSNSVSKEFLSHLVFTENCLNFYAHSKIDFVSELRDIVSQDDVAGTGTYISLAVTCNRCNPAVNPYGISHSQHLEQSDYDGACASLSGDLLSTIKYIISKL